MFFILKSYSVSSLLSIKVYSDFLSPSCKVCTSTLASSNFWSNSSLSYYRWDCASVESLFSQSFSFETHMRVVFVSARSFSTTSSCCYIRSLSDSVFFNSCNLRSSEVYSCHIWLCTTYRLESRSELFSSNNCCFYALYAFISSN